MRDVELSGPLVLAQSSPALQLVRNFVSGGESGLVLVLGARISH